MKHSFTMGIKLKLVIGFAIPLVCTIIVGIGAYSLAASGMTSNYEDSMSKAMALATEYLDFSFASAVSESEQLYYNEDLMRWATGAIYNEWTKNEIMNDISLDLNVKKNGNDFISNMYIIPGENLSVVSTYNNDGFAGFYNDLKETEEAVCLNNLSGNWIGRHPHIDEVLAGHYSDYSTDSYACSYIRPMTTKRACIVVD